MAVLILFPVLPYPFHNSGASQLIYQIIELLSQKEEVDLMVFQHSSQTQQEIEHVRKRVRELFILPFPIPGQRRCLLKYRFSMKPVNRTLSRSIHTIIREKNYHLIVSVSYLSALLLHPYPAERMVVLPIDAFSRLFRQLARNTPGSVKKLMHRFSAQLFAHFERKALHHYKKTVVVSQQDCRYLNQINPRLRCEAIPLGIDRQRFLPNAGPREPLSLLFTGNYAYSPNQMAAIFLLREIMPLLNRKLEGVKLYLVGINPSREMLSFQSSRIIIPGFVEDIDHYYRSCELFICPLNSATGIKNKILEAASAGMPILATRKSLEGIDVDNESCRIAHSSIDFADQAYELLSNPSLCRQLGEKGQKRIQQHHDRLEMSQRYVDLIMAASSELKPRPVSE